MLNYLMTQWIEVLTIAPAASNEFSTVLLPIVIVVGISAAIGLGSVAWYNSKRPMGWEDKKRPNFIPKIEESGEMPAAKVNFEKDYEKSKGFSTPDHEIDAAEISASLGSSFNPENKQAKNLVEGNPEEFLTMAQEIREEADG
jgi:hypothetical protein